MSILLIVIHVIVCIALIMIVLLQTGKGADMGAAFGGGSSQTLFGSTGASTFLSKATTVAAIVFMLTSLILAYVAGGGRVTKSVITDRKIPVEQSAPATSGTDTTKSGTDATKTNTDTTKTETDTTKSNPTTESQTETTGEKKQ